MAEQDWTLVEYRPGRYVKVSPEGDVIGRATEAEARAWFSRRGWPLEALMEEGAVALPEPGPAESDRRVPVAAPEVREEAPESVAVAEAEPRTADVVGPAPVAQEGLQAPDAEVLAAEIEHRAPDDAGHGEEPLDEGRPEQAEPLGEADIPEEPEEVDEDRWLWLDPRGDARHGTGAGDLVDFLSEAAQRFRAKDWARGSAPGRLAVHPDLVTEGLEEAAAELGLEVVADPKVMVGTYMLALAQSEERG